jgi:alcohol dehydrogenase
VRPGERVAGIGTGGTGSVVMGAVAAGASQVIAIDRRHERLERAQQLGATAVVQWQGEPEQVAEAVVAASGGGVDYAIDCTGRPGPMRAAFLSTRKRGAAVMAGIPRARRPGQMR